MRLERCICRYNGINGKMERYAHLCINVSDSHIISPDRVDYLSLQLAEREKSLIKLKSHRYHTVFKQSHLSKRSSEMRSVREHKRKNKSNGIKWRECKFNTIKREEKSRNNEYVHMLYQDDADMKNILISYLV